MRAKPLSRIPDIPRFLYLEKSARRREPSCAALCTVRTAVSRVRGRVTVRSVRDLSRKVAECLARAEAADGRTGTRRGRGEFPDGDGRVRRRGYMEIE